MHCTNCGTTLQPGVVACPTCGTPVAYNPVQQPSYDPTIVASPYGTPQNAQTEYGANPYGTSQSNGAQYNPYGSVPQAQNPYGYNQPVQQPPFYGYPQGQPQGGYVPGAVPGMPVSYGVPPAQLPKKRSRVGLIIGIVVGVALLLCVGIAALVAIVGSQAAKTTVSSTKSISQTGAPSGKSIVDSAAAILHNPQTSTVVDKNFNPTHVTSTFTTNQYVYVTFDIDSGNNDGYIQAKWYTDGQLLSTRSFAHSHLHNVGLFSRLYTSPTTNGVAELYWCTKADCGDAQLAQVVHFTVNATGLVPTNPGIVSIQDAYRRIL